MTPRSDLVGVRATRAIVDLDAIAANVGALRRRLPACSQLMAVVKADAYGHGAPWVSRAALAAGASLLGVATVGEGAILRRSGIESRVVVLGSIGPTEVAAACRARLEVTVGDVSLLDALQAAVRSEHVAELVSVHLKVDTGLRRYGAVSDDVVLLADRICGDQRLRFAGMSTHFASADEPDEPFTVEQLTAFEQVLGSCRSAGIPIPARHAANSAGILTGRGIDYEIARAGIAVYGIPPSPEVPLLPGMRPAMRIESRIARIVPIAPGESVGYNRTFRAREQVAGALVPIGYGDGYRRSLSNRGWVGIAGRPARILGRVSMDQTVVAIPSGVSATVGDTVHILGNADDGAPSAIELAELMETNPYEVLVGIRKRIPRIFECQGEVVAVRKEDDWRED